MAVDGSHRNEPEPVFPEDGDDSGIDLGTSDIPSDTPAPNFTDDNGNGHSGTSGSESEAESALSDLHPSSVRHPSSPR